MSEEIIPDVTETSDVVEAAEAGVEAVEQAVNYSEKTLAEIVAVFEELVRSEDRMSRSKEAEAVKAAFYRRLQKEKSESGIEISEDENPFVEIETGFKDLYNKYKSERAEHNRQLEKEREENLALKEAVIADLKALIEKQEDVSATFPEFREIQNRWRAVGPVPVQSYRNINETYQLYVEQFYDMVKINRELRDLDFRKNLEAKEEFCRMAEELAQESNVIEAFRQLQKLHEQWKDYGPVAKEFRESVWERFKAATAVINRNYQAHFEGLKEQQAENLAKKTVLCEKVEEIAAREVKSSNEWNAFSKEIEQLQQEWKQIGFASKKDNQKVYDRFRAACDGFYGRKRDFYTEYKDNMNSNLEKKTALCEQAEALRTSTDWKNTAEQLIGLQKQWKEIGAVPRKKSDALWKRFRAACDEFFAERDKNVKRENDFYGNLKAKQALVEEIEAYSVKGDASDAEALKQFQQRWQEIGFVPFKEKDKVAAAYRDALQKKFHKDQRRSGGGRGPKSEKDRLIARYNALEQDIATYENNIGFFSTSRSSQPLVMQMQERIEKAKAELKVLADRIREAESEENKE